MKIRTSQVAPYVGAMLLTLLSACVDQAPTELSVFGAPVCAADDEPEDLTCPSMVEACRDLETWCTGGVYFWPRKPQDVTAYGVEPRCFCMCDDNAGCDGTPGAYCGILFGHDESGEKITHFPEHAWFNEVLRDGEPRVCITDDFTPAPAPAGCGTY